MCAMLSQENEDNSQFYDFFLFSKDTLSYGTFGDYVFREKSSPLCQMVLKHSSLLFGDKLCAIASPSKHKGKVCLYLRSGTLARHSGSTQGLISAS